LKPSSVGQDGSKKKIPTIRPPSGSTSSLAPPPPSNSGSGAPPPPPLDIFGDSLLNPQGQQQNPLLALQSQQNNYNMNNDLLGLQAPPAYNSTSSNQTTQKPQSLDDELSSLFLTTGVTSTNAIQPPKQNTTTSSGPSMTDAEFESFLNTPISNK
jgi:hypothetical protein